MTARKTSRKDLKEIDAIQIDGKERANGGEKLSLSCPHWVLETQFLLHLSITSE